MHTDACPHTFISPSSTFRKYTTPISAFNTLMLNLNVSQNSAAYLRSQRTWRWAAGLEKPVALRQRVPVVPAVRTLGCGVLCHLDVCAKFDINVVTLPQRGTTRFPKEGWICPGQKQSGSKLPCWSVGEKPTELLRFRKSSGSSRWNCISLRTRSMESSTKHSFHPHHKLWRCSLLIPLFLVQESRVQRSSSIHPTNTYLSAFYRKALT